jgi:N utilization substance protein A
MAEDDVEQLARIFEREVPEIADGTVVIKAIARKPGVRSKLALHSSDPKVDCIGVCVGIRGHRIKNIVDDLGGTERIDLFRWHASLEKFITNALQPAVVEQVIVRAAEHRVTVLVQEDQLSLAMGRRGVNRHLASQLCGWEIEILTMPAGG